MERRRYSLTRPTSAHACKARHCRSLVFGPEDDEHPLRHQTSCAQLRGRSCAPPHYLSYFSNNKRIGGHSLLRLGLVPTGAGPDLSANEAISCPVGHLSSEPTRALSPVSTKLLKEQGSEGDPRGEALRLVAQRGSHANSHGNLAMLFQPPFQLIFLQALIYVFGLFPGFPVQGTGFRHEVRLGGWLFG